MHQQLKMLTQTDTDGKIRARCFRRCQFLSVLVRISIVDARHAADPSPLPAKRLIELNEPLHTGDHVLARRRV